MTSAREKANKVASDYAAGRLHDLSAAIESAITEARREAFETAAVTVLNDCGACGGMGDDQNALNDPGPCPSCTPTIDAIRALKDKP